MQLLKALGLEKTAKQFSGSCYNAIINFIFVNSYTCCSLIFTKVHFGKLSRRWKLSWTGILPAVLHKNFHWTKWNKFYNVCMSSLLRINFTASDVKPLLQSSKTFLKKIDLWKHLHWSAQPEESTFINFSLRVAKSTGMSSVCANCFNQKLNYEHKLNLMYWIAFLQKVFIPWKLWNNFMWKYNSEYNGRNKS